MYKKYETLGLLGLGAVAALALSGGCVSKTVVLGPATPDPDVSMERYDLVSTPFSESSSAGLICLNDGQCKSAAGHFELAEQENPEDHNSIWMCGLAYEQLRELEKACSKFKSAYAIKQERKYLMSQNRVCQGCG